MLFENRPNYEYIPFAQYCEGYPDWANPKNTGKVNPSKKTNGWRWLQGRGVVQGEIFSGCLEVLEMLKATKFWPKPNFWTDKIFFLETSEEKPSIHTIDHALRNYGMQGVFDRISALIFGRARDYTDQEKQALEGRIVEIVKNEFGRADLLIITNFDTGHTDPQFVLPLGIKAEINCMNKKFSLIEPWLSK